MNDVFFKRVFDVHLELLRKSGYHESALTIEGRPGSVDAQLRDAFQRAIISSLWTKTSNTDFSIEFAARVRNMREKIDFKIEYNYDPVNLKLALKQITAKTSILSIKMPNEKGKSIVSPEKLAQIYLYEKARLTLKKMPKHHLLKKPNNAIISPV